jgi:hypothetical protein
LGPLEELTSITLPGEGCKAPTRLGLLERVNLNQTASHGVLFAHSILIKLIENSQLLWKSKAKHGFHKTSLLAPIARQFNPLRIFETCFCKVSLNTIHLASQWPLPMRFCKKKLFFCLFSYQSRASPCNWDKSVGCSMFRSLNPHWTLVLRHCLDTNDSRRVRSVWRKWEGRASNSYPLPVVVADYPVRIAQENTVLCISCPVAWLLLPVLTL